AGIPDPGEPFGVAQYWRNIAEQPDPHGERIRESLAKLKHRLGLAELEFANTKNEPWWDSIGGVNWHHFRHTSVAIGVPEIGGGYRDYVDFLFAGDWVKEFSSAVALS